jgi:hypothetical protein
VNKKMIKKDELFLKNNPNCLCERMKCRDRYNPDDYICENECPFK